eukprot:scaffold70859_cov51-Attheya_sp.AAC.3
MRKIRGQRNREYSTLIEHAGTEHANESVMVNGRIVSSFTLKGNASCTTWLSPHGLKECPCRVCFLGG